MNELLRHLLVADIDPTPIDDLDGWKERHDAAHARFEAPFATAVAGGFAADRVGYAFASGYCGALAHLRPSLSGVPAALCVTEARGGAPKHMTARLEPDGAGHRLSGEKTFVTLGDRAEQLLVVASEGVDHAGRNRIAVVQVPASREGIAMAPRPATPFVPEIPHAVVTFAGVRVSADERIPGDGYLEVVKPFRTIEDIHVNAALVGLCLRFARIGGWPHDVVERLMVSLMALAGLVGQPPLDPTAHVALAGVLDGFGGFLGDEMPGLAAALPEAIRTRLSRDAPLFGVAGKARSRRRVAAWASLATR